MDNSIVIDLDDLKSNYDAYNLYYSLRLVPELPDLFDTISIEELLQKLSSFILQDLGSVPIYYCLKPVYLELVSRIMEDSSLEQNFLKQGTLKGSIVLNSVCKIIGLTSEVSSLIEHFLEQEQFFSKVDNLLSDLSENNLHIILLAFYRLLKSDRERFKSFVQPQVLYNILQNDGTSRLNKFLAIQLLAICLNLAESVRNDMIALHLQEEPVLGLYEGDKEIDYNILPLLEAQRFSNFTKLPKLRNKNSGNKLVVRQENLSSKIISVCGILIPSFSTALAQQSALVPISKSLNSLAKLAQNVQSGRPTMMVGKSGTGKTFLINELAKLLNKDSNSSIVKIHLNDQTDAKILLGTYTSGSKPGTFEWKNGVLTTAVKEGKWVLIEDIDKAPTEVLSILLTLLEKRELTIPSRGEVIKAANGFQLIATIRIPNDAKDFAVHDMIGLRMWDTIDLPELNNEDLYSILKNKFPLIVQMLDRFISMFETVSEIYSSKKFFSLCRGSQPRVISVRDFVKFCGRVNRLLINNGFSKNDKMITTDVYDMIFQEAVDCFTSSITEEAPLHLLINEIGQLLEIPTSRIHLFVNKNTPQFDEFGDAFKIGRATLNKTNFGLVNRSVNTTSFAKTSHSLRLMEQIGVSISMCEPVLLVGETGTGKTTVVQQVAKMLHKKLTVINVSQQTEVGDLLGGYKPVNAKIIALPIQESFEELFNRTFSLKKNAKFVALLSKCFNKSQWKNVVRLWKEAHKMSVNHLTKPTNSNEDDDTPKKKRKLNNEDKQKLLQQWNSFYTTVDNFEKQAMNLDNAFAFQFVEGTLVKAVRNGDWLLLDEINLASPETLESIADLLADSLDERNIMLSEKGDVESIKAHPDFRLFGCMNPSTDVGKRDLPISIRSRFSEIYVHSPDRDITDLLMIIDKYIGKFSLGDEWCGNDIAQLYLEAKSMAESNKIVDGANQKPHFSIRTLTRTLIYVCDIVSIYGLRRSLYEGFCMSFLTLLDLKSEDLLKPLIEKHTIGRLKNAPSIMRQIPADPSSREKSYVQFRHYWMMHGPIEIVPQPHYIITPFVEKNMLNLVRATSGRRFPVLIQGPTSSGKTSMINYLASITGHKFVRINNHEHTDLQEYLGTYISDTSGKLVFKEGVLVEALRKGHWIVLDELNLAPTDVLEALNRLLDDNRELFIPETQEFVHPHPDFMLFATQNPPGLYGGRKILSRAFRNRFLELHFDDIPQDELETILRERCQIAPSYGKKIVEVYKELSVQRQATRFMEQGQSFATLRDLFRWAQREAVGYEELAANGYMLLAERVRREDEKQVVKQVIEKVMKVKLDMLAHYQNLENSALMELPSSVVWTKAMRRLSVLVSQALKYNEPLLLVGETGCGKTTICQLIASFTGKKLIAVNAHQNTETGDILGAQRPLRNRSELQGKITLLIHKIFTDLGTPFDEGSSFETICKQFDLLKDNSKIEPEMLEQVISLRQSANVLFEWTDGPLIQALKEGEFFLLDEISLADDSVLERLNSVLEPERSLLLAEKGTDDAFVTADPGFKFLATMNPGGDYGKKELSPALRNRFTEIWVPSMDDFSDVRQIVTLKLDESVQSLCEPLVQFSEWYGKTFGGGNATSGVISLRDILAWVLFINSSNAKTHEVKASFLHGACMVFIDALGTNNTAFLAENESKLVQQKRQCVEMLSKLTGEDLMSYYDSSFAVTLHEDLLKCGLFEIPRIDSSASTTSFNLQAPTTAMNAMRVIRAMQVHKPILLEGSPGVGKTSLISALASATGNNLTRINLSEQTDLIDLFGSDAPSEGGETGEFVWRDAPFLRAMQKGEWVLLDEMNLASQSVLEGLNACLDHRGEAYIPELDKSFTCHPNFLVFAAQNPQYQGGGRKGLPKSFVNRFSVVYVDMLKSDDLNMIAQHLFPDIDPAVCSKLITFISRLEEEIVIKKSWGLLGAPWEFNLRDTLRWLELCNSNTIEGKSSPVEYFDIIVGQRFRSAADRTSAKNLFLEIFEELPQDRFSYLHGEKFIQAGHEVVLRRELIQFTSGENLAPLRSSNKMMESILTCINHSWPLILTGSTGSGKTSIIRLVASLVGAKVDEFSMNNEVDSMDILGGYEQVDLTRDFIKLSHLLKDIVVELTAINFVNDKSNSAAIMESLNLISFIEHEEFSLVQLPEFRRKLDSFMKFTAENESLLSIRKEITDLLLKAESAVSVKFKWFDGLLVQSVEQGNWLILDNANLCSPSVLDRLNSLLEPNGTLIVNECSDSSGQPRVIKPHPNFRLFLTVDPKYGELSRAMRNRAIEIYLEPLETSASPFDRKLIGLEEPKINSTDLETSLSTLTLQEKTSRPTSSFFTFNDSSLFSYFTLCDVIELKLLSDEETLLSILTTSLSLKAASEIRSWHKSVVNSSEFSSDFKDFATKVLNRFEFLKEFGVLRAIEKLYAPLNIFSNELLRKDVDYYSYQLINPLLNSQVSLKSLSSGLSIGTIEPFYFFESAFEIMEFEEKLERLEYKALNGKLNELNYLEKSAALVGGRNIKNGPKLNAYGLVKEIYLFIKRCTENAIESDSIFNLEKPFESLFELQILWRNLFICCESKNDSKMRVYQSLIEEWITKNHNSSIFSADLKRLNEVTASFTEKLSLKSGWSIELIWEHFRSTYPTSEEAWENRDLLAAVSSEFDLVSSEQFYENTPIVNELRLLIVQLYKDTLNDSQDEFDSLYQSLSSGVQDLRQISSRFLNKRLHQYQLDFDSLLNFIDSFRIYHNNDTISASSLKYLDLYLLAGRSTESLLNSQRGLFKPYPEVFDYLWNRNDISSVQSLFTDGMAQNIYKSSSSLTKTKGYHLHQSLKDFSLLGAAILENSDALKADQKMLFKRLLVDWFIELASIHLEHESIEQLKEELTIPNLIQQQLEQLHRIVVKAESPEFVRCADQFFFPALLIISKSLSLQQLGEAWVLFSAGCINLFVPSSPLDPITRQYVEFDIHNSKESFYESFKNAWIYFSEVSGSIVSTLPHSNEKSMTRPRIYRPAESSDSLFDSWNSFMDSSINSESIKRLLEVSKDFGEAAYAQLQLFQKNSNKFISRVSTQFLRYSDLNDILKGFVFGLKLGFELITLGEVEKEKSVALPTNWPVNVLTVTSTKNTITLFNKILESHDFRKQTSNDLLSEEVSLYFMRLYFIHAKHSVVDSEDLKNMLDQVFQGLYYKWTLRRMKQQEAEAAESSLFRQAEFEVDLEEDFKSLFPDFEDVLELPSSDTKTDKVALENLSYDIAKLYLDAFNGSSEETFLTLLDNGLDLSTKLKDRTNVFKSDVIDASQLTVLISLISSATEKFKTSGKGLDFYRGYSPVESKRCLDIIQRMQESVHSLLQQWPEHATLQLIYRVTSELLAYPSDTPVAKLLSKVEQVYTFVAEWEKYAHSKNSLKVEFEQLTNLIVSWRKLELSTWRALFDFELLTLEKNVGKWWFYLFETIIVPLVSSDEYVDEAKLLGLINIFLSQTSYGEFGFRLRLLKAFREHLRHSFSDVPVLGAISNIITFYEQFQPAIDKHIEIGKKALEKSISDIILLASWRDVNIDALKQSARRSHLSLYKIVRKYRALLAGPISSLIEQGLSSSVNLVGVDNNFPVDLTFSQSADLSMISDEAISIFPKDRNIMNIERNMKVYVSLFKNEESITLYPFAKDVLETMEELKRETPTKFSEETKKEVAALKTQKRKLLSDTIKELRRMGLKTSISAKVADLQSSVNKILAQNESFNLSLLEGSDAYFFRLLDLMPRLRASVSSCAEDVPVSDAQKGLYLSEHLLSLLIETRKPLLRISSCQSKIKDLWHSFEYLSSLKQLLSSSSRSVLISSVDGFNYLTEWIPKLCDHYVSTISSGQQLSGIQASADIFLECKSAAQSYLSKFAGSSRHAVLTVEQYEVLKDFNEYMKNFTGKLNSWMTTNPKYAFVGESFIQWLNSSHDQFSNNSSLDAASSSSVKEIEEAFKALTASIMISVQKIIKYQKENALNTEDDKWFILSHEKALKYEAFSLSRRIQERLETCLELISRVDSNEISKKLVTSYSYAILPLLYHHFDLSTSVLNKLREHYYKNSHATFILATSLYNLATNGFCSPEEPEDQPKDENMKDGTGLGDGEGATNNSNDVEEDEDLAEQAQQANEDQKEKDELDDNDDAVDIEGDMAGELEDAPLEDSDDEEAEDEKENEDLDDEIDDIDDLDPNAIDDKMWDEEAQENSKEKDSEKMPENAEANEELMANEDEEDQDKKSDKDNKQDHDEPMDENAEEEHDKDAEEDGDDEEDVAEQEDAVVDKDNNEELDPNIEENEALELPEDMNLDSGDEDKEENGDDGDDDVDDIPDVNMDDNEAEEEEHNKEEEVDNDEQDIEAEENDDMDENPENEEESELDSGAKADDINEEGQVESDEEEIQNNEEDKSEEKPSESADNNPEGLEGLDEVSQDVDMDNDAAAKQNSGQQGEGADDHATEEQDNIGSSGMANQQEQENTDTTSSKDQARDEATESLKQLGDTMKEFHRRRQEILELTQDELAEQSANERPDEFQHVDGENTEQETQALGAASKDQIQSIDDEMAIDDDEEKPEIKEEDEEEEDLNQPDPNALKQEELEGEEQQLQMPEDDFNGQSKSAFMGERKPKEFDEDDAYNGKFEDEMDLDTQLEEINPRIAEESDLSPPRDIEDARDLWRASDIATQELSAGLCEQLRLILEPTLATKLKGDYKTGKRLNMKRIIPYIASQFRKDKIWLRRTKPSKRQYQIMIAVDDSKSMAESKAVQMAFESIALVSKALTQLESGGLSIVKFGEDTRVVHPFDKPFTSETGAKVFQWFDFQETRTDIKKLCSTSLELFNDARGFGNADLWQLEIIISDGFCEDHETVQRLVRRAREEKVMLVFVIIDGLNTNESIMDMSQISYVPDENGKLVLKVDKYLDTFPFEFYVVVHDISELPEMLSVILRQYFSELASL